jgi:hypothetical protein
MIDSDNLTAYYKTISNTELLNIIENEGDYQPFAVEIARKEFSNRQLSELEIKEARQPILQKKAQREKQGENLKKIESAVRNTGNTIIDTLNPIINGIPTTERIIRFLIIVFSGVYLYNLASSFSEIKDSFRFIKDYPVGSFFSLFPFIILPVAIFLFWKRKSVGWSLFTVFLTFSVISSLFELYISATWAPSDFGGFAELFPRPNPITPIIKLLFYGGALFAISKSAIRNIYSISEQKTVGIIGTTVLVTFFLTYSVL